VQDCFSLATFVRNWGKFKAPVAYARGSERKSHVLECYRTATVRESVPLPIFSQLLREFPCAGWPTNGHEDAWWRTHSCVLRRDSPETSAQALGNTGAAAPKFLPLETFPTGTVRCSSRRLADIDTKVCVCSRHDRKFRSDALKFCRFSLSFFPRLAPAGSDPRTVMAGAVRHSPTESRRVARDCKRNRQDHRDGKNRRPAHPAQRVGKVVR
jgi:hypothetical protein